MKYYSEFTTEYVNDICNELSSKGLLADKFEKNHLHQKVLKH